MPFHQVRSEEQMEKTANGIDIYFFNMAIFIEKKPKKKNCFENLLFSLVFLVATAPIQKFLQAGDIYYSPTYNLTRSEQVIFYLNWENNKISNKKFNFFFIETKQKSKSAIAENSVEDFEDWLDSFEDG